MNRWTVVIQGCLLTLARASTADAQPPIGETVQIVSFLPSNGTLHPGDTAVSRLVLFNAGRSSHRVWIGYSVENADGEWFDVPSHSLTLGPGERSLQTKGWPVPLDPQPVPGEYRATMAVWTAPPETEGARRLAAADRRAAFHVHWEGSLIDEPPGMWLPAQHYLGRGRMRRDHVLVGGAGFRLRLPAASCDGAEVRASERYHFGEYTARMKVPDAPGSISAFFLYSDVSGGNDEIDIEIYNDGSRQALLTAWVAGRMERNTTVILPFDPAAGYHDYTIRWSARDLVLLADGARLARWTSGFPRQPMRVMANVWWPTWLSCVPVPAGRELSIERIRLAPITPPEH